MIRKAAIFLSFALVVSSHSAQGDFLSEISPQGIKGPNSLSDLVKTKNADLVTLGDAVRFYEDEVPDTTPQNDFLYDFVIVGAGSAGSVIAARLTETPEISVLLIEAGGNENLLQDIPLTANDLRLNDKDDWLYQTEPSDRYCLAMEGNSCRWPRGKVMGGSSVLNHIIAVRGNRRDYDLWAQMGNAGWSYDDLLQYFKKLEAMKIPELKEDVEFHNTNGPVNITRVPYRTIIAEAYMEAGHELGYNITDYNGRTQAGFSYLQTNIYDGRRESSNKAYLHPARGRKNLHVTMNSLASKVVFLQGTRRAIGVEFMKAGQKIRALARKEVIMCAGAIGSPQILMLSGIGPSKHLSEIGIPLIQDAPVGKNLMDHYGYGGMSFTVNDSVSLLSKRVFDPKSPYIAEYLTKRSGPLTVPSGSEVLTFIEAFKPPDSAAWPNIELGFQSSSFLSDSGSRRSVGLNESLLDENYKQHFGQDSWNALSVLMRPKSRGRIFLRNSDINSHPRIVPNYLSHKEDVAIITAGIREIIRISKTEAMRKFGSTLITPSFPGCDQLDFGSDQYWECATRYLTYTLYHYSGTCKMGPQGDHSAVVDPRLKVYGVDNLRVADASIIPIIPAAHLHLVSIVIAEKLSDMILEDWKICPGRNANQR